MSRSVRTATSTDVEFAGVVQGGRFRDQQQHWELVIPEGWIARPGSESSPLRVTLEQVGTGTHLEVWTYSGTDLTPRRRERCNWTFVDEGHFAVLPQELNPIQTATCVPEEPRSDRLFAYMVAVRGRSHHFEIHVPTDALVEGKSAGEAVIQGMSWPTTPAAGER